MEKLTRSERELVALGAALGSNCVPCIEFHIPEARRAGLDDRQIREAIHLADKVRQVPAAKVLAAAKALLPGEEAAQPSEVAARATQESPGAKPAAKPACGEPAKQEGSPQPCCG